MSAGDYDYELHGAGYAQRRRTDPRIAARVHAALGDARTVLNVGAGAGSYEPADRCVLAVEPSAAMRAQRPPGSPPVVDAIAEALPLDDDSVDAAMATITVHQWRDPVRGLHELRRVARGSVVVLTADPDQLACWWLGDYVPELLAAEARRLPSIEQLCRTLGGRTEVQPVPVPNDCVDGFTEASYARPELLLDEQVRAGQSGWRFADPTAAAAGLARLAEDLRTGEWDRSHPGLRTQPELVGALRLVVAHP